MIRGLWVLVPTRSTYAMNIPNRTCKVTRPSATPEAPARRWLSRSATLGYVVKPSTTVPKVAIGARPGTSLHLSTSLSSDPTNILGRSFLIITSNFTWVARPIPLSSKQSAWPYEVVHPPQRQKSASQAHSYQTSRDPASLLRIHALVAPSHLCYLPEVTNCRVNHLICRFCRTLWLNLASDPWSQSSSSFGQHLRYNMAAMLSSYLQSSHVVLHGARCIHIGIMFQRKQTSRL